MVYAKFDSMLNYHTEKACEEGSSLNIPSELPTSFKQWVSILAVPFVFAPCGQWGYHDDVCRLSLLTPIAAL